MRHEVGGIVAGLKLPNYNDVFDRALTISIGLGLEFKQTPTTVSVNRNWQPNFKRNQNSPPRRNNYNSSRIMPYCRNCKKNHSRACLRGTETCYRCHQTGHEASECPMPANGRPQMAINLNHQPMGTNQYQPQPMVNFQARQLPAPNNRQPRPQRRGPPNQGQQGRAQVNAILDNGGGKEEPMQP